MIDYLFGKIGGFHTSLCQFDPIGAQILLIRHAPHQSGTLQALERNSNGGRTDVQCTRQLLLIACAHMFKHKQQRLLPCMNIMSTKQTVCALFMQGN